MGERAPNSPAPEPHRTGNRTWRRGSVLLCRTGPRRRIDPALTYFRATHYHRPWLLDCRVRKGNGYFQPGMGTGRRLQVQRRRRIPAALRLEGPGIDRGTFRACVGASCVFYALS